jgi:hypothetical protein
MATELMSAIQRFEDQPRIRDIDLALALGYGRPTDIRELIGRNRAELEDYGIIRAIRINTGERGRPATEYWLTEDQALCICLKAETEKADDVRKLLIGVFRAYKRGELAPVEPNARATRLLEVNTQLVEQIFLPYLKPFQEKLDRVETTVTDLRIETAENFTVVNEKLDGLRTIAERTGETVAAINREARKKIRNETKTLHIECLVYRRAGICPCCKITVIVENWKLLPNLQFDHWYRKDKCELTETWPVCAACNHALEDSSFRNQRTEAFREYQRDLEIQQHSLFRDQLALPTKPRKS